MEITSYLELLKKQRRLMTQQQISAIQEQARLHAIASEKMQIRDRLEERYRELFAIFYFLSHAVHRKLSVLIIKYE